MKTPAAFICAWLWLSAYFGPGCHGADFSSQRAELLSKQGEALYSKIGSPQEAAAALGQFFLPGDRLRTLELSRATVRFSDASQFTMKELTTLDILAPPPQRKTPALDLKAGFLYFFSRGGQRPSQWMVWRDCSSARDVRCNRAIKQWPVPLPGGGRLSSQVP